MTIHQEVHFKGTPKDIYDLLLNSARFQAMTGGRSAHISTHEGGEVSMFGGDIEARNVELVPNRRIVQTWRSRAWPEGTLTTRPDEGCLPLPMTPPKTRLS